MRTDHLGATLERARSGFDRKHFLRISGAGIFGSLLIGSPGSTGSAFAQSRGEPEDSLMQEFRESAEEYGLPVGLLSAMSYVNTRWEMPPPEAGDYEEDEPHGLGTSNTLDEVAELAGISEEDLKRGRAPDIKGEAALLAASQGDDKPREVSEWFRAVTCEGRPSQGARDVGSTSGVGGELCAEQVFTALKSGARKRTRAGKEMALQAQDLRAEIERRSEERLSNLSGGEDNG